MCAVLGAILLTTQSVFETFSLNAWFNVISRKQSGNAVHDAFPPSVIVLFQHVNNGTFLKTQFVVFVRVIVVDSHN